MTYAGHRDSILPPRRPGAQPSTHLRDQLTQHDALVHSLLTEHFHEWNDPQGRSLAQYLESESTPAPVKSEGFLTAWQSMLSLGDVNWEGCAQLITCSLRAFSPDLEDGAGYRALAECIAAALVADGGEESTNVGQEGQRGGRPSREDDGGEEGGLERRLTHHRRMGLHEPALCVPLHAGGLDEKALVHGIAVDLCVLHFVLFVHGACVLRSDLSPKVNPTPHALHPKL